MNAMIPIVLKFTDWPEVDRLAWEALLTGPVRFGRVQPKVRWTDGSKRIRMQGYGQWLSFLKRTMPDQMSMRPTERITRQNVEAFLEECDARLKPRSVYNLLLSVAILAQHWDEDADWEWLWAAVTNQRHSYERLTLRRPLPVTADQIYAATLRGLQDCAATPDFLMVNGAVLFRQRLLAALLISCPVRVRALAAMTVTGHVMRHRDEIVLHFVPEDMKDKKARQFRVPDDLVEPLTLYIEVLRPMLLNGKETDALWISRNGKPITEGDLSKELHRTTKRLLGVGMHAHAFRHVAATTIAEVAPEQANIIRDILGHATIEMSVKHYNLAEGSRRCNELQSIVGNLRSQASASERIRAHDARRTAEDAAEAGDEGE